MLRLMRLCRVRKEFAITPDLTRGVCILLPAAKWVSYSQVGGGIRSTAERPGPEQGGGTQLDGPGGRAS